jgi:peptidoglycan-N-acetylglucosamine deacetylase
MVKRIRTLTILGAAFAAFLFLVYAVFCVFFDQAVFLRKDTFYAARTGEKIVALTFDDGPSPLWTPQILAGLKDAGVKATFFMLGEHVEKYPDVARMVADQGHEVENHTYSHHVLIYYTMEELENEIHKAEQVIREVTGVTTRYFRPPKAWLTEAEKSKIKELGYETVLWSLNSKDWVTFDDKYIVRYLVKHIRAGDIILFHDSGGVFSTEGGSRHETVLSVSLLIRKLRERGYRFVTVRELLEAQKNYETRAPR